MAWKSTSDSLPKDGVQVLGLWSRMGSSHIAITWKQGDSWFRTGEVYACVKPTYWHPTPELPEQEVKKNKEYLRLREAEDQADREADEFRKERLRQLLGD